MITQISNNVWFDPEKLFIIKGKENAAKYLDSYDEFPFPKEASKTEVVYPVVTFLSSMRCNLGCVYCYAQQGTYNNVSEQNAFSFANYVRAYETILQEYGAISAICFFGGEPLLNFKEIKKFVTYLFENYPPNTIPQLSIGSNGTIMNDEILAFLSEYNVLFGTSLDGAKQINDISRVGKGITSVHDRVIETIYQLHEYKIPCSLQVTFSQLHLNAYQPGHAIAWMRELENLPIMYYEIIAATTEGNPCEIDLHSEENLRKLQEFCAEIARDSLSAYIDSRTTVMSNIFPSLLRMLSKKEKAGHCGAGNNITISPDMRIYPCHTIADQKCNSIPCEPGFRQEAKDSDVFTRIKNMKRIHYEKCNMCFARNVCGVFCKGMCLTTDAPPEERCIMMRVFLRETILFMADVYPMYRKEIAAAQKRIATAHQVKKC